MTTNANVQPVTINGEEYFNMVDAATYTDHSMTALRVLLDRRKGTDAEIQTWTFPDYKGTFIKKADLDRLKLQQNN